MKKATLSIIATIFLITFGCKAQNMDCFEIKYLDFFGIAEMDTLNFPEKELDQLLKTDFAKNEKDKKYKTNFIIPLIVMQLKPFYSDCNKQQDTVQYNKLIQLYFNIRQQDKSIIKEMTLSKQLEFIRQDYYSQVLNDTLLPYMTFTFDDGPIYGEPSKTIPNLDNGKILELDIGKLIITNSDEKILLVKTDKDSNINWVRIMTSAFGEYLKDLEFSPDPVEETSRAYIISMYSQGERLTLYLKLDGEFMYYYHSW